MFVNKSLKKLYPAVDSEPILYQSKDISWELKNLWWNPIEKLIWKLFDSAVCTVQCIYKNKFLYLI